MKTFYIVVCDERLTKNGNRRVAVRCLDQDGNDVTSKLSEHYKLKLDRQGRFKCYRVMLQYVKEVFGFGVKGVEVKVVG